MLYIASDVPLPLLPWDPGAPAFHVEELDAASQVVRERFTLPSAYYAGSHEGCGCGFQLGEYPDFVDEDAPAKRESLRQLADYVDAQHALGRQLQFFMCWAGDEECPPDSRRVVTTRELRGDSFWFLEGEASSFAAG
ncbi:MAG: hypothetical protein HZA53_04725 [Planctomycetes bacterium]|nr:hypothetical protein [Planctomycetota bacterium]